jgi:hypothetical protein
MKFNLFKKRQPEPCDSASLHTPEPSVNVPEFSVQYRDSKPEHVIFSPNWIASGGCWFNQLEGIRIFNILRDHYPELKQWRVLSDYSISTYQNLSLGISGIFNDLKFIVELVDATQIAITAMLDDYLYHRDMSAAHKEQ